eukprot:TRINITY_DN25899_c0_g1_i1.p1 TRINITY_DN25899_c0_g1~~TRINITY_DN25899_c0_g1_i1.p1  ORF type:complete len:321 (+),score=68.15 TRINITY_DN25899_c0_g1_i1:37-999(+)
MGAKKRGRDAEEGAVGENTAPRSCLPLYDAGTGAGHGGGDSDDDSAPPVDGYEYLRRVAKQAKKCPKTVVAEKRDAWVGSVKYAPPTVTSKPRLPEHLIPKEAWRCATLAQFKALRREYIRLRPARGEPLPGVPAGVPKNRDGPFWKSYCFGNGGAAAAHPPALAHLLGLEPITISWLVVCHKNWLCNSPGYLPSGAPPSPEAAALPAKSEHNLKMCYQALCGDGSCGSLAWLYSLLVCLEEPLIPEHQTALAELLWTLCKLWMQLDTWDLLKEGAEPGVPCKGLDVTKLHGALATVVCVVHSHFKQGDPDLLWPRDSVE